MQEIQNWAEQKEPEMIADIMRLVRIKSVSQHCDGAHPYGEGCARVLDCAQEMARGYGFETENHEYRCASVLYPGKTDEELAVCTHLDVVPENTGWSHDPYDPYLKDGWIYGRGAADNKGAAVASLYVLRYLSENDIKLHHTVRLLLGCDEEAGMSDMAYYLEQHKPPAFALVPDAGLPAVYAEKAGIDASFAGPLRGNLLRFDAGLSRDSVPAHAEAVFSGVKLEHAKALLDGYERVSAHTDENGVRLEAKGLAAHAAFPERGLSAAALLAKAAIETGIANDEAARPLGFIQGFQQPNGSGLGIACSDELTGALSVSGCLVRTHDGVITHSFNCRGPVSVPQQQVWERAVAVAEGSGFTPEWKKFKPYHFISPSHPVIAMLTRNAAEAHGIPMEAYAMGGGTYARMFPHAVAAGFGLKDQKKPCLPGHGGGHQPDECVSLLNLKNGIAIYAKTLMEMDAML